MIGVVVIKAGQAPTNEKEEVKPLEDLYGAWMLKAGALALSRE